MENVSFGQHPTELTNQFMDFVIAFIRIEKNSKDDSQTFINFADELWKKLRYDRIQFSPKV